MFERNWKENHKEKLMTKNPFLFKSWMVAVVSIVEILTW